jgi:60 kDa SS-A/Ro ribonucleoprotein
MANKQLFSSQRGRKVPAANTCNHAGGVAYRMEDKHGLAQLAATGCLSRTFYASAHNQLDEVLELANRVDPEFLAKTAVYARKRGYMKDMPALLLAVIAAKMGTDYKLADEAWTKHKDSNDPEKYSSAKSFDEEFNKTYKEYVRVQKAADALKDDVFVPAFHRVLDNPKMLRNFVQIVRSGVTGRKSLGSILKKEIQKWLAEKTDDQIFRGSVGNDPSVADIIKMVHPRPESKSREALYGYLLKREYNKRNLPKLVKQYEKFKEGNKVEVPDVPFQMLTSFDLDKSVWMEIARNAHWQMTRMNLNTFERHSVMKDREMVRMIAERLANEENVRRARAFPYQLMMAYTMYNGEHIIKEALQDAMETAVENVPKIDGRIAVFPDISGSMYDPVTGQRGTATTKVKCVDVAGLISSVFLRHNPDAIVIPFGTQAHTGVRLNPRDSIMTNARILADMNGGGTNCSAAMEALIHQREKVDMVVYVSDNESWMDSNGESCGYAARYYDIETRLMKMWEHYKAKFNRNAKLVCMDLAPNTHAQAIERDDILNVGGFGDACFDVINMFYNNELSPDHWVGEIEKVKL